MGIGQSTCVGVGGDMIPGSSFIDILPELNADENTKAIVLIGEIGGNEEELAAEYIKQHVKKPRCRHHGEECAERPQHGTCMQERLCPADGTWRVRRTKRLRCGGGCSYC